MTVAIKNDIDFSLIEEVVMKGDLSQLSSLQRVAYYNRVCESIGLNPLTRPFDYINLNGKLTLYAKKDATEQLRMVKKISITELEGKIVDDLFIVKAKACTPDGRIDQATGAVSIGTLKGESKANAIMKAETKAKRRVTLSISGLGWTDESEIDSIPHAKKIQVDHSTGEIEIQEEKLALPAPETKGEIKIEGPLKGYDEFVIKHDLAIRMDGSCSNQRYFLAECLNKSGKPEVQMINAMMKNEDAFVKKFEAWNQNRLVKSQGKSVFDKD